mmetsp:Transcript_12560/g.50254  ORF Transcript_12560/g.50254 Transcript_12560/m.50254 type:complete len:956 (+) Transcript_12560:1-2868(+)
MVAAGAGPQVGRLQDGTARVPLLHHCVRPSRQHRCCLFLLVSAFPALADQETARHGFPLLRACKQRLLDLTEFLLDNGADANRLASTGMTALRVAAQAGDVDGVQLLLRRGAVVDLDFDGSTTLHQAVFARSRLLEVLRLLLDALGYQVAYPPPGAVGRSVADAVNAQGDRQRTAVHLLCANRSNSPSDKLAALRLFRAAGADLCLVDNEGDTPWHWACRYGNHKLAEELYDDTAQKWPEEFGIDERSAGEVVIIGRTKDTVPEWFSSASELVHQYPPLDCRSAGLAQKAHSQQDFVNTVPRLVRPLGRRDIVQVACGNNHFIALTATGTALSWGDGSSGQLGTGYHRFLRTPAAIDRARHGGQPVVQVACGGSHSLLLTSVKSVFACGSGQHGQLGSRDPTPGEISDQAFPRLVHGLQADEVVQVVAGNNFSAALTKCSHVYFWGSMVGGPQLCLAPMLVRQLLSLAVICRIAAGRHHILAFSTTGEAFSWGRNNAGQLGQGEAAAGRPGAVLGLPPARAGTGGLLHSAAVARDGRLFAWGSNVAGQLGLPPARLAQRHEAAEVPLPAAVVRVACGSNSTAAVGRAGELFVVAAAGEGRTTATVLPASVLDVAAAADVLLAITARKAEESEGYAEYVASTALSDITVVAKDERCFPAHRFLLAARSSVIRDLLASNSSSQGSLVAQLEDGKLRIDEAGDTVLALLRWMYTGRGEGREACVGQLAGSLGVDLAAAVRTEVGGQRRRLAHLADVSLRAADGEEVACHRVVLAGRAPYFRALLAGAMQESRRETVSLPALDAATLEAVLEFLYAGVLRCPDEGLVPLLVAADLLDLVELKWEAEHAIVSAIDDGNVIALHRIAVMHGAYTLKEQCERYREKKLLGGAAEEAMDEEGDTTFRTELALLRKLAKIREVCEEDGAAEDEELPVLRAGGGDVEELSVLSLGDAAADYEAEQ